MDDYEMIQELYVVCAVTGLRQGGIVFVGPFNAVPILIAHPTASKDEPEEEVLNMTRPVCPVIGLRPGGLLPGVG